MTRKEILVGIAIILLMAVLAFFGYKDWQRQQRLKEEAGGISLQDLPAEAPIFSRADMGIYFV
ncbi:MAG: hypothetical protein D6814_07710 [Calditrichaeota bacterium]|nr:MAG: hypothetical protein D6814_07710 [Calditrichota bacterium]